MNQREIKFRAYFPKDKEWWYGCFHPEIEKRNEMSFAVFFNKVEKYILINLGEFTGLKDKNDKEIYEGDIVSFRDNLNPVGLIEGYVIFEDGSSLIQTDVTSHYRWIDYEDLKVIGNIYENPKLLK